MLHRPTEAQLKRQIAGAISYGGGNLSAFKLCSSTKGGQGSGISWAADKGMWSRTCQSIHLPMVWGSLFLTVWGSQCRLHTVPDRMLPAYWELIWKGPQSAGDLIWLFQRQLQPVFWANSS